MSTVFLANGTLQHHRFHYRLGVLQEQHVDIRAGAQVQLPNDFSEGELADVLRQLHRRGAVPHDDVQAMSKPFTLVYKIVKGASAKNPIPSDTIDEARERDEEVRQELSGDKVEALGRALMGIQEHTLAKHGADPQKLQETSTTIRQLQDTTEIVAEKGGVDAEYVVSKKQSGRGQRRRS